MKKSKLPPYLEVTCLHCGVTRQYPATLEAVRRRFCSTQCRLEHFKKTGGWHEHPPNAKWRNRMGN